MGLTDDDEYVFFEVNPGGQWLFAEIMTGQEMSWSVARPLLGADDSRNGDESSCSPSLHAQRPPAPP